MEYLSCMDDLELFESLDETEKQRFAEYLKNEYLFNEGGS